MTYLILLLVSLLCITIYLTAYLANCGVPTSISETYYNNERKWLLPIVLLVTIGAVVVPMFDLTPEELRCLVFLVVAGILFVASAPAFKESLEGTVHSVAAIVAGVGALVWLIFLQASLLPLIAFVLVAVFDKKHKVFWLECGFAASLYLQLIRMSIFSAIG